MAKKAKVSKVTEIAQATVSYNEAVQAYKDCINQYEVIKARLSELRLKRDMARVAMHMAHQMRGVTVHSEEA